MISRRFSLLDAMILVAATAVATNINTNEWFNLTHPGTWVFPLYHYTQLVLGVLMPHVAAWGLAVVVMGLRKPRPPLRRMIRRPGIACCIVSSICLVVLGLWVGANSLLGKNIMKININIAYITYSSVSKTSGTQGSQWISLFTNEADRIGFAVAGAWLVLALGGRWSCGRGWIERFGLVIGCCWIGAGLVVWLRPYLLI